MLNLNLKKILINFLLFFLIFALDRFSKIFILNLSENSNYFSIYINEFLSFILIWNSGIGFGLFSSENNFFYNLTTFLIGAINLFIIYLTILSKNIKRKIFIIILGGSMGNLFDRVYYGAVPDFIDISFKGYHWFIFNVADIFITIGIFCLIFIEIFDYKKTNEQNS